MAERVGQQVGNYLLVQRLGEGGFAEVYLGEHIHLGTQAAIKILSTKLTPEDVEGFRTEARTIARLKHPHIVRVLEFGVEGGTPFLVMDYAPHGTLRTRHPKGSQLAPQVIVSYVQQIAEALQYAHEQKLIHRDIKPENMLIGDRQEILLSDFGIALVAQSSRYQSTQEVIGTVAYMAPEQIQGHPRQASDQYALGIVIYEWLGGSRPFQGSFTEIATQHILAVPPPLEEKVPGIPSAFAQVVMTALAKDPKERFASMAAFARALEQSLVLDAPTQVVRPSSLGGPSPIPSGPPTIVVPPAQAPSQGALPPTVRGEAAKSPVGRPKQTVCIYRGHHELVRTLVWSPDGRSIASGSADTTLHIWDRETGTLRGSYPDFHQPINALDWSPDGRRIATAGKAGAIHLLEAATGRVLITLPGHGQAVYTLAWSPDRVRLGSGGADKVVRLWDAEQGRMLLAYSGHAGDVGALAWSPDGSLVASGSGGGTVQIWQASNGRKVYTYFGHPALIYAISWSPDGKRVASASQDGTIQVWDALDGETVLTYIHHTAPVWSVKWSPQGRWIASASEDGTVHIWDALTTANREIYRGHTGPVYAVAWSPDGQYLASAGKDRTAPVWQAPV